MKKKYYKSLPKNEPELINAVVERYTHSEQNRSERESKWEQMYNLYRMRTFPSRDETVSRIFIPEVYTVIETLLPRLIASFINTSKPYVTVLGRNAEDHEHAKAAEKLLQYQFECMEFPLKLVDFYKQALIYGTSIAKVIWDNVKDEPFVEVVDIRDIFVDPDAQDVDTARWIFHRSFVEREYLERHKDIYGLKDKDIDEISYAKGETIYRTDDNDEYDNRIEDGIEILEYWTDDRLITIANRTHLLRDIDNPFAHQKKPFVRVVHTPIPFEFYGMGAIEPIAGLQLELNTKRNQRLDNVNFVINRMWMAQRGAIDDERQLVSRPGGIIVVNDIAGVQPLPTPDVTASSYEEEKLIKLDIQNVSGISDYIRGLPTSNRETATEIQIKTTQASNRFEFTFKLMAEMGIKRIAEMILLLDKQFLEEEKVIRVLKSDGVNFEPIYPEQLDKDYDLIPAVDPIQLTKKETMEKASMLFQALIQMPFANQYNISRKLVESLDFHPQEMLIDPMQAQMQQQQMMMGMGGGQQMPQQNESAGMNPVMGGSYG